MNNNIIELPDDMKARRSVLEHELRKVVIELSFTGLRKDLNELFDEYNVTPKPTHVSWDFYGEYDDEGGTTYYPNNIAVYSGDEEVEYKNITINKKSSWSNEFYDYELGESIMDIICNYRHDLYEHDIEEITL